MASATDTGCVYHVQYDTQAAAIVTYKTFRQLLAAEFEDVDDVLLGIVPDAGMVHSGRATYWVTLGNSTFTPPPRNTVGPPVGVTLVVGAGSPPASVTTVIVKGKKGQNNKEKDK